MTTCTWLITSTTYGTWLLGDARGSVSQTQRGSGGWSIHNQPGTPYDSADAERQEIAHQAMLGDPVYLTAEQASIIAAQFQQTSQHRGWELLALAIMANHFHLVVSVPTAPPAENLLRDFKCYASRRLNEHFPRPASGSCRALKNERAIENAFDYVVIRQHRPHIVWSPAVSRGRQPLNGLTDLV